jgi:hypothetical protein
MPAPAPTARHPSVRALHEHLLATSHPAKNDEIAAHVAACERCRADLRALEADHQRFEREVFPQTHAAMIARATPWLGRGWTWPARGVLAAVAALLVLVGLRHDDRRGAAALAVFVARGERVQALEDGRSRLRAGDRLRFVLSPAGQRFAVIAAVDGAGHARVYFPAAGDRSAPLATEAHVDIPDSIELDDAPGPARVFAVMSARPLATAAVTEALRAVARHGAAAIRATRTLPIEAATVESLLFEKSP